MHHKITDLTGQCILPEYFRMGVMHDGHGNECYGQEYSTSIMAAIVQSSFNRYWWSSCSRKRMTEVIEYVQSDLHFHTNTSFLLFLAKSGCLEAFRSTILGIVLWFVRDCLRMIIYHQKQRSVTTLAALLQE